MPKIITTKNIIERQLLTEYKSMKYEPIKHFGGHTECLKIEALKSIRDVLT